MIPFGQCVDGNSLLILVSRVVQGKECVARREDQADRLVLYVEAEL